MSLQNIATKLGALLVDHRPSDGDWAEVTKKDMNQLVDLFDSIIKTKFQPGGDGDTSVEFYLVDRNNFQSMHFAALPYPSAAKGDIKACLQILKTANMNLGLAQNQVDQAVGHLEFELRHKGDGNE